MRHSFIDKYSYLDSPIHRMNPRPKLILAFGFIILFIYIPLQYFIIPSILLLSFIFISGVPVFYCLRQSLIIIPFILLAAISNKWTIILRAYSCVLTSILLSSTTKFSDIIISLRYFGCPKIFIMIMAFMYRYFYVIVDELMRMKQAKDTRTIKRNNWNNIKTLSHLVGIIFFRTYERAERVYKAMCARGFTGEIK